jgi:hypothetical protein
VTTTVLLRLEQLRRKTKVLPRIQTPLLLPLQLILNIHMPIILRDCLAPRRSPRLQMSRSQSNRDIRNEIVRRFSRPMRNEDAPAEAECQIYAVEDTSVSPISQSGNFTTVAVQPSFLSFISDLGGDKLENLGHTYASIASVTVPI